MALSYKVFPGTPYYSNTNLTTKAGEIVNTTAATYVNTTYGTVSVGGSTYYVAYGMMVSFWNSSYSGTQIDNAIGKVLSPDSTPTENSTNLVTSGGVKSALDAMQTTTTGSLTLANGLTVGTAAYAICGKVMQITLRFLKGASGSSWVPVAYLPSGKSVPHQEWSVVFDFDSSYAPRPLRVEGSTISIYAPTQGSNYLGGITLVLQ